MSIEVKQSKNPFVAIRSYLVDSFNRLNLFSDHPYWSLNLTSSEQIFSTRLFLILISICLLILSIYSSLILVTNQMTLEKFSLNDFERLEKLYPQTINVPCTEISIMYDKFLNVSPILHEVCSSPFVTTRWISSLFLPNATSHNILDFRTYGFAHYRSLKLFCRIARQTIRDNQRRFSSNYFTNRYVLSRNQFNEISSVLFHNFQKNLLTNEKQTARLISMMTARNRLISALRTNYYIQSKPGSRNYITYNAAYRSNQSICDCRLNGNQCFYPAGGFYNWTKRELGKEEQDHPPAAFQVRILRMRLT